MARKYDLAKERARSLFLDEGVCSPTIMEARLRHDGDVVDVPGMKQLARWIDEFRVEKGLRTGVNSLLGNSINATENEQDTGQPGIRRSHQYAPAEPPTLEELIQKGVPEKEAPALLARWDIAYEENRKVETWKYFHGVSVYQEFPGIPLERALDIGYMEAFAQQFDVDMAHELAVLARRYRPWESQEHQLAFNEVYERVYLPRLRKRRTALPEKRRGLLARLLSGRQAEDLPVRGKPMP
jgi:hypothetical protein